MTPPEPLTEAQLAACAAALEEQRAAAAVRRAARHARNTGHGRPRAYNGSMPDDAGHVPKGTP